MNTAKKFSICFALLVLTIGGRVFADSKSDSSPALRDATILIIRHAEKPASGSGLSTEGERRATAYVNYFKFFKIDSRVVQPDYLFATADSAESDRPRLTLEPLSTAFALKKDCRFKNKKAADLALDIQSTGHGKCILIAWHHGEIPELLRSLGADPAKLLPGGKWPEKVFDWVIELRYDDDGHLVPQSAKRISENLMPDDK